MLSLVIIQIAFKRLLSVSRHSKLRTIFNAAWPSGGNRFHFGEKMYRLRSVHLAITEFRTL